MIVFIFVVQSFSCISWKFLYLLFKVFISLLRAIIFVVKSLSCIDWKFLIFLFDSFHISCSKFHIRCSKFPTSLLKVTIFIVHSFSCLGWKFLTSSLIDSFHISCAKFLVYTPNLNFKFFKKYIHNGSHIVQKMTAI